MRCKPLPRLGLTFAVLVAVLFGFGDGTCIPAARAAVQDRVTVAISNENLAAISNSVHPRVKLATDLGPASGDTRLQGMSIRFTMTAAQQAALDQLLADQQNPASPRYHQWLTPTQFAAQFGLSSADLAKVSAWLTNQGFIVTGVANGGTFITFDGTVGQAQTAFSTSIHNLSVNGETHFANITDPSVPSAFASVAGAITGLDNFRLKPHLRIDKTQFTSSVTGGHYLAPGDVYTIYDAIPLLKGGLTGAGIGTGSNCHSVPAGTTCGDIAVTGQTDLYAGDALAFRTAAGLSATNLPTTVTEGCDPGIYNNLTTANKTCDGSYPPTDNDLQEASLDVEWSGAMAPSASILFVNGYDTFNNSMTQAIDENLAPIVTTSYGACEADWGSTELNTLNQLFKQANAQGQTILAAAGDDGAADCDGGAAAIAGLAVDFPASSPYVTGMGGTMFNDGNTTFGTPYWSSPDTTLANAGVATGADVSALSYIPESTWNENLSGYTFSAGGGGISAFFNKPTWQIETGPLGGPTTQVPGDASRDVPDLALNAASGHDGFLYCAGGSCTVGFRAGANGTLTAAGGTSFDSQIFGGMLSLIEQKTAGRIGNINPTIYALGNSGLYYNTTGSSVFHDVTSGNNEDPCTTGTLNCPSGPTLFLGYTAGTGYDLTTGWGSVDLNNLANAWKAVTPLGSGTFGSNVSTTNLTASSTSGTCVSSSLSCSVVAGATVTLTAAVSGSSVTPTGTVQFLMNNAVIGSPVTLVSGTATYTYTSSCSALGQQIPSASYSGDTNYAGSKGPVFDSAEAGNTGGYPVSANGTTEVSPLIITVATGTCPNFSVTPASSAVTVTSGSTIPPVTITVAPTNGFIGNVVFSYSVQENTGYVPTISLSPASVNITATTTTATTALTLSGITASLHLPDAPGRTGQFDSGTLYAQQDQKGTQPARRKLYAAGSGVTIASLLLLALPRRRRLGGLLLLALSIAIVGGASGCGGGGKVATITPANPEAGAYLVTVTGTYTSSSNVVISNSTTVTYTIY